MASPVSQSDSTAPLSEAMAASLSGTDKSASQQPSASSHLTVHYVAALSLVALLSISGQVLVQWALQQQSTDAHVINIAGRQRMLSQMLCKVALTYEVATAPAVRKEHMEEVQSVAMLWERSQAGLQRGDAELGLPGTNSPEVTRLFARIEPHHQTMLRAARRLVAVAAPERTDSPGDPETSLLVEKIMAEGVVYLEEMNEIVFQYDREASTRLLMLKQAELMFLGATLTLLLLIGLFLFRPAVQRIRQNISILEQADRALRTARDGLETQVEERTVELSITNNQLTRELAERRRVEEELRHSEERFRSLVQHSSDIITILREDGQIQYESPSIKSVLGYEPEELVGKSIFDFVCRNDRERFVKMFSVSLPKPGVTPRTNFQFRHKDGSCRAIEAVGNNLLHDPNIQGIVVNARDVTEQESITEQLRQAQKMEAVGRLSGGVAHDFNNLLTVIRGNNELLLSQLEATNPLRRYAEEVQKTSDRASSLTKQLLTFSRRQVLEPKVLDINGIVSDSKNMLRRLIGENIELTTVLDSDLSFVRTDPGQIQQIILNLAVNARDAMPQGGTLAFQTSMVELDETFVNRPVGAKPGSYVLLTVNDTGLGMTPEILSHVFEPFFTTKEKGKGTGLGLATVYGIVKQSQGYLSVWSEPGKGTTFKIYFPRIDATQEEPKPELTVTPACNGTATILVVEDEMSVRRLTRQFLENEGYTVLEAVEGQEAIEISRQYPEPIHLLLTDIVLPRMRGDDVARQLALQRPGLRVLYMSGYADVSDILGGALKQNVAILQKPFSQETLAQKVREVLKVSEAGKTDFPLWGIRAS